MELLKFFKKDNKHSTVQKWGGTGTLPALGSKPAISELPSVHLNSNLPKVPEPSAEELIAAKKIIEQNGSLLRK